MGNGSGGGKELRGFYAIPAPGGSRIATKHLHLWPAVVLHQSAESAYRQTPRFARDHDHPGKTRTGTPQRYRAQRGVPGRGAAPPLRHQRKRGEIQRHPAKRKKSCGTACTGCHASSTQPTEKMEKYSCTVTTVHFFAEETRRSQDNHLEESFSRKCRNPPDPNLSWREPRVILLMLTLSFFAISR